MINTILVIAFSFVTQAIVAAFVYGKLTQSLTDTKKQADKIEKKVDGHETRISHLEGAHI